MARLGDLVVTIGASTKSFDKALGDSMRKLRNFGKNTKQLGKNLSMGVTAPLAIMGGTAVQAFRQQAKAIAQVEAGLKSTGGQVGYTSKQLQQMASGLQAKTLFGDEQILQDATAQLLTFTNISGDQFARTQQAALDLATRLDGDLKGASIQLGKALNDPVANLSALSRSGIQFSDEQKEVIKSMAESGRLAEAQTLILDELNKQYGGSAEAAAKADGGFTQLANSFGDLQEQFGAILVDILRPLIEWATDMVGKFQGLDQSVQRFIVVGGLIAGAIGPLLFLLPQLAGAFSLLLGPVGLTIGAIALLGAAIYYFSDEVGRAIAPVINWFISLYNEMEWVRMLVGYVKTAFFEQFKIIGAVIKGAWELLKDMGTALWQLMTGDFSGAFETFKKGFADLFATVKDQAVASGQAIAEGIQAEIDKEPIEFVTAESISAGIQSLGGLKDAFDNMFSGGGGGGVAGPARPANMTAMTARTGAAMPAAAELVGGTGPVTALAEGMGKLRNEFSMTLDLTHQIDAAFVGLGMAVGGLIAGTMTFGEIFAQSIAGLASLLMDLGQQFIAAGVAASAFYASIISNPPLAIAAGVALVAAGAAIKGFQSRAESSPPALAKGGLAFGETLALVGDNPNAGTDPEVIAPLSKLQGMMGGGQAVTVTGRISGRDILISNERAAADRSRNRGY